MGNTVPIFLRVPKHVFRKLEEIKERKGKLNVQEVIRETISEYLEKEGGKGGYFEWVVLMLGM